MKRKIAIFILIIICFSFTGCEKNTSKDINYQTKQEIKEDENVLKDALNLNVKLFKDDQIEGLENIYNYLIKNNDNSFAKKYLELYNRIGYENLNEFQKHLIETYSYYLAMEGYTGTSESGIYGWLEDHSFQAGIYVKGYDVQNYDENYNIAPISEKRTIVIVEKKYTYTKPIYVYHEVTATTNEDGKITYDYKQLNWGTELHVYGYSQIYADSYIIEFNEKNKDFSKLLYDYGYEILGGGEKGTEEYKKSVQTAINKYEN